MHVDVDDEYHKTPNTHQNKIQNTKIPEEWSCLFAFYYYYNNM